MRIKLIFFFTIGLLILLAESCTISSSAYRNDYTYLYDENQQLINPEFKIFHKNQDTSILYYQLRSNDILYGKVFGDSILKAKIIVKYRVFATHQKSTILDSATLPLVNYGINNENNILQGKLQLNIPAGSKYPIEIRFRDQNKDLNVVYQLWADKRDNNNEQYFILRSGKKVLTQPIITKSTDVSIEKSSMITEDKFILNHSSLEYAMTAPPFAQNLPSYADLPIDSSNKLVFKENIIKIYSFGRINSLTFESSGKQAFRFYKYASSFPEVGTIEQMMQPIRYISTSSEFKKVKNAVNYKKAIDAFWLGLARNEERAKKMIKEYYSRVEISNRYFTSFSEGWKTDRGIIYIVYGIPTTVYKGLDQETWIYGEEDNILSVKFNFIREDNSNSTNDFKLVRNSEYKNNWYRAVDMWRQAKVY